MASPSVFKKFRMSCGAAKNVTKVVDAAKVKQSLPRMAIRLKIIKNANGEYSVVYGGGGQVPAKMAAVSLAVSRPPTLFRPVKTTSSQSTSTSSEGSTDSDSLTPSSIVQVVLEGGKSEDELMPAMPKLPFPSEESDSADEEDDQDQSSLDSDYQNSSDRDRDLVPSRAARDLRRMAQAIVESQCSSSGGDDTSPSPTKRKNAASAASKRSRPSEQRSICDQCQVFFASPSNLRRHKQTVHVGLKPYLCRWTGCTYNGKDRSSVLRHIRCVHLKKNSGTEGRDASDYVAEDLKVLAALHKEMVALT